MKHLTRVLPVILLLAILLLPVLAYADTASPETLEIEEARAWRHMLEPDDVLMIVRYNCYYGNLTSQPSYDISNTFYFTYGNSTGSILGNETAYPYFNLGYGKGLVAFYWAADDENRPAWGDPGNVTISGTSLFDSPPSDILTLTEADWVSGEAASTQREDLRQWLLNALIYLEVNWNTIAVTHLGYDERQIDLTAAVSGGDYATASTQGEAYLGLTIPNITSMCRLLFLDSPVTITHTERDWQLTQQNLFEAVHEDDIVGQTGEVLSSAMGGIDPIWAMTVVMVFVCLVVIILSQTMSQKLNAGMLIAYAVILIATPEGLFQMGLMALFAVVAVLYLSDIILTSKPN